MNEELFFKNIFNLFQLIRDFNKTRPDKLQWKPNLATKGAIMIAFGYDTKGYTHHEKKGFIALPYDLIEKNLYNTYIIPHNKVWCGELVKEIHEKVDLDNNLYESLEEKYILFNEFVKIANYFIKKKDYRNYFKNIILYLNDIEKSKYEIYKQAILKSIKEEKDKSYSSENEIKKKLFKGSKNTYNNMLSPGGRFYHLNISDIILPGIKNEMIDTHIGMNECGNFPLTGSIEALWDNESWHALLVGDGGMGKTVSLIRICEKYFENIRNKPIPIFIALNEYNTTSEGERKEFIINSIGRNYLGKRIISEIDKNELWEQIKFPNISNEEKKFPSLLLLLDGFNEVSIDRTDLIRELKDIIKFGKGCQIIITSRLDVRDMLNLTYFNVLKLLNLDDCQIANYLSSIKIDLPKGKLLELIRNPMMLTLYASTCHVMNDSIGRKQYEFKEKANTTGEMFWNFIESFIASKSPEQDEKKLTLNRFILKHLLPYIGWNMEKRGVFYISTEELRKCINVACATFDRNDFYNTFPEYMEYDEKLIFGSMKGANERKRYINYLRILVNELAMLIEEKGTYRFLHQNFRDFFAALYILNEIKIGLNISSIKIPDAIKDFISDNVRKLLGEIEGEHYNIPIKDDEKGLWSNNHYLNTKFTRLLNACRNIFDGSLEYAVWNIIQIFIEVRGQLTGCDLSNLDLSNITLNGVVCSKSYGDRVLATKFSGSRINEGNMFSQGHSASITSVDYCPDGRHIVSTSADSTIKVWNTLTGACIETLYGHTDRVCSACYSPDGRYILSASFDWKILRWDTVTNMFIPLCGHKDYVRYAYYSSDGKKIISASDDRTIKIWDANALNCINTIQVDFHGVNTSCLSPDGEHIIFMAEDDTINIWNISKEMCTKTLQGYFPGVENLSFSPDGKNLTINQGPTVIMFCNIFNDEYIKIFKDDNPEYFDIKCLSYSPDGRYIVSNSMTVKIWDTISGKCVKTLTGHFGGVTSAKFSDCGKYLVSASADRTIKIWDTLTGECIRTLWGYSVGITSVRYSPDGQSILSTSNDGTIKIWDALNGKCIKIFTGHLSSVISIEYSPDRKYIVSASKDDTIKTWNYLTGECNMTLQCALVTSVEYSIEGKYIIAISENNKITVWDSLTGDIKTRSKFFSVNSIYRSPEGNYIVVDEGNHEINKINFLTGEIKESIRMDRFTMYNEPLVCSPDGKHLIMYSPLFRRIEVWEFATGECRTLCEHSDRVNIVCYSPDGKHIVSTSKNRTIKILNTRTGECKTLEGHTANYACFSPNSEHIVFTSDDSTIKIWNTCSGKILKTFHNVWGFIMNGCEFKDIKLQETTNEILKEYGCIG